MCVVCMERGGGAGGIFISFPCAIPRPPFPMTFPTVLGGWTPTFCSRLWGWGRLEVVGYK